MTDPGLLFCFGAIKKSRFGKEKRGDIDGKEGKKEANVSVSAVQERQAYKSYYCATIFSSNLEIMLVRLLLREKKGEGGCYLKKKVRSDVRS